MTLVFNSGWDTAKSMYPDNQVYLDCFNEDAIRGAINRLYGDSNPDKHAFALACGGETETVYLEQGLHQPQNIAGYDGFTLHFTARWRSSAWHFYVIQNQNGSLTIDDLSGKPPKKKFKKSKHYYFGKGL